jgi:hypothetical protein
MASITFYQPSNGKIVTSFSGELSLVDLTPYESYAQIEDFGDSQTQYVENGYLVNIPEKPFVDSVFDYDTKSWANPSADTRWQFIRLKRNNLLSTCDWTQSIDSPLSSEKKNEWATYRQALRDVTNQADPFNLVWPTQPE